MTKRIEKKSYSIPKAVIPGKLQSMLMFLLPKVMYKNGTKNKANSLLKWRFRRRPGWLSSLMSPSDPKPSTFQLQWGT